MQVDTQDYLRLVEGANKIVFVDIESTGFNGDYNSALVISCKPYNSDPTTFAIEQVGNDQKVVRETKEFLEQFDCWVTYYGKGFDIPFLNTRLLKWKKEPLISKHHIDLFYALKYKMKTSSKSLSAMASFFKLSEQKMGVDSDVWSEVAYNKKHLKTLKTRCESDTRLTQLLYDKTKHLIKDIKR